MSLSSAIVSMFDALLLVVLDVEVAFFTDGKDVGKSCGY